MHLPNSIIVNAKNIFYLTGFMGTFGVLVFENGIKILLTDNRYKQKAEALAKKNKFEFLLFSDENKPLIAQKFTGKFALEASATFVQKNWLEKIFPHIKWIIQSEIVEVFREIKTKQELEYITTACQKTDKILESITPLVRKGITEKYLEIKIREKILYLELEDAFSPIVAFGENSALPHHSPGTKKLETNMNILIDFGVRFKNFCSDITRNFWFGDAVDADYKYDFDCLLNAQKQTISSIKTGNTIRDTAEFCRKKLGDKNVFFSHSLGHGIGIDVHEKPNVSIRSKDVFEEYMTLTVEPGIYRENKYGIRIEDTIVVEKNKAKILTYFPKELIFLAD